MKTIEIELKTYNLRTDSTEYQALAAELQARELPHFNVWHMPEKNAKPIKSGIYHVELEHLFADQMNVAEGFRLFDWYDGMPNVHNREHRIGHYVEAGPGYDALQEVRRSTVACGYCGKQEPKALGTAFCPRCLDSAYLKETELHLLRMLPVIKKFPEREPLSEAEAAGLLPRYREAQVRGLTERAVERAARKRVEIAKERDRALEKAKVALVRVNDEFQGYTWLLDHGIETDNVIYYSHTGKFSFGWRSPVSAAVKSALLDIMSEFPFPYEIKCEDGEKLEAV